MQGEYDIRKTQEHIIDILQDIIRVCDKLHITYFIMGGTALGAYRHGGFIPWDDDLDIGMLREDYDRFLKEAAPILREDLFLQTFETQENSPFYFAKVRKDNTEFVEYYCKNLDIHSGIYVDIFPYDNIPEDKRERRKYYRKSKRLLNIYIAKTVTGTSVRYTGIKRILYGTIRHIMHIVTKPIPKKILFQMIDNYLRKYNEMDVRYAGYGGLPKIQVEKYMVTPPAKILFEGILLNCPNDIEKYLESNYGNYMELPPENQRKGHDPYIVKI